MPLVSTAAHPPNVVFLWSSVRRGVRQRIEIAFASLKGVIGLGETSATMLIGLAMMIAKNPTCTYGHVVYRRLGQPQGRIKEL